MKTNGTTRRLRFGSRNISYHLRRMPRKRLRIVVTPDLKVRVDAPEGAGDKEISEAVRSKGRWLMRQLDEIAAFHPLPQPCRFESGETLVYLGRQYRLKVLKGEPTPAKLKGKYLQVRVRDKSDTRAIREAVNTWYRTRAEDVFGKSMERCNLVASRHGAKEPTWSIRKMRTRWGSCTADGKILLNLYLVQVPVHCIDYVVMHELCHTAQHNHSKKFYQLLTRCLPDWEKRKALLNQFSVREM